MLQGQVVDVPQGRDQLNMANFNPGRKWWQKPVSYFKI
jgi:hypothetical protein